MILHTFWVQVVVFVGNGGLGIREWRRGCGRVSCSVPLDLSRFSEGILLQPPDKCLGSRAYLDP